MSALCNYRSQIRLKSELFFVTEKLQSQLLKQPCLENEDEMFLALAGIKQVCPKKSHLFSFETFFISGLSFTIILISRCVSEKRIVSANLSSPSWKEKKNRDFQFELLRRSS